MFPSRGQRVISSAGFFGGFGPVMNAAVAAAAILAQVLTRGPRGMVRARFV